MDDALRALMEAKLAAGVGMTAAAFTLSCIGTWRQQQRQPAPPPTSGSVDAATGVGARIPTKASASCAGLDAGYNNGSFGVAFSPLRESPAPGAATVDSSVRTVDLYESDAEELQHRSPAALLPAGSPMNDSVATASLHATLRVSSLRAQPPRFRLSIRRCCRFSRRGCCRRCLALCDLRRILARHLFQLRSVRLDCVALTRRLQRGLALHFCHTACLSAKLRGDLSSRSLCLRRVFCCGQRRLVLRESAVLI